VLAALYADENRTSVLHRQAHLSDPNAKPPPTKLDKLKNIWQSLLPHRQLLVLDGNIQVKPAGAAEDQYDASELSDGERVIFYLIGQTLLTRPNSLLIVDEPELQVNRSILGKLWDAIESARKEAACLASRAASLASYSAISRAWRSLARASPPRPSASTSPAHFNR
jgi:AAA domain, putative AbiEii toxin, Type IV TA system